MSFRDLTHADADIFFNPDDFGTPATVLDANNQPLATMLGVVNTPTQTIGLGKQQRWLARNITFLTAENQLPLLSLTTGQALRIEATTYHLTHVEYEGTGLARLHLDNHATNTPNTNGGYYND
jgi:hypothetical protein